MFHSPEKCSGHVFSVMHMCKLWKCILPHIISLTLLGHQSLSDVRRLYFKMQQEIFQSKPSSHALDTFLKAHLGTEIKMNNIQHPKLVRLNQCIDIT